MCVSVCVCRLSYRGRGLGSPPQQEFPPPPSRILKNYVTIALKEEKMAVVLHTSDGNLGAVS